MALGYVNVVIHRVIMLKIDQCALVMWRLNESR